MQTTTQPVQTVVVQQTGGGGDPKAEYYRMSAEKCFCNASMSCCTCHCCALCMMIMWIIFGSLGAYSSWFVLDLVTDGNYITFESGCTTDGGITVYDKCCVGTESMWGGTGTVYITGVTCDQVETVYTIGMVDGILACIAGVTGIVGICGFIAFLLFVPLAYSIIAIIFDFVIMATLGFGDPFSWLGIAISCLIVVLFYYNWKIMKDAMGMM